MTRDKSNTAPYPSDDVIDAWADEDGSTVDMAPLLAWAEDPDGPPPPGWSLEPGRRAGKFTYGCMGGQATVSPGFAFDAQMVPDAQ